jgi:hypothetical protein
MSEERTTVLQLDHRGVLREGILAKGQPSMDQTWERGFQQPSEFSRTLLVFAQDFVGCVFDS